MSRRIKERIQKFAVTQARRGANKFSPDRLGWKNPTPDRGAHGALETFLQGLQWTRLGEVGPVTAARLRDAASRNGRRAARSIEELTEIVGMHADWLVELAHGRDDRPVEPNRPSKSAGSEETYATDLQSMEEIRREIDQLARGVAEWLGQKGKTARTVTIKVRYSDFTTITRSQSAPQPSADAIHRGSAVKCWTTEAGRTRDYRSERATSRRGGGDAEEDAEARLPFWQGKG